MQGFNGQVRVDGAGAVTNEQGKVHHLAGLAALNNERDLGAGLLAHQAIVHGSHGQQAGDGRVSGVDAAVGDDEQRVAGVHGVGRTRAEVVEGMPQSYLAVCRAEECGQCGGQQVAGRDAAQLLQIAVGEDGMGQLERVAVLRRFVKDVALGADVADERHDQFFADGIDGWVGHLGEELLEVVKERLRTIGETGQRDVGAHGADGFLALGAHGAEQDSHIFFAVAISALAAQQGFRV